MSMVGSYMYIGTHRMGAREAREIRRAERTTAADVARAVWDWCRLLWQKPEIQDGHTANQLVVDEQQQRDTLSTKGASVSNAHES